MGVLRLLFSLLPVNRSSAASIRKRAGRDVVTVGRLDEMFHPQSVGVTSRVHAKPLGLC